MKFVKTTVEFIAAGTRNKVDHTTGVPSVFGVVAAGLHFELGNGIGTRNQSHNVAVWIIYRDAVKISSALVRSAATDLIVPASEHILPG